MPGGCAGLTKLLSRVEPSPQRRPSREEIDMVDHWSEFTRFGIGLFALLSPFTALPYVLSVSSRFGSRAVLTMAGAATATMILVLSTMHLVGEAVLITLGTSLPSF